ncbi:MAG TPA: hypothetical protein VG826_34885 [Pirellulales bacterium]|nr:hypothetical protein [Pirellulales bacterium]
MSRRFQFSLKTLLGLALVVCLVLGGWPMLKMAACHLEVADAVVGRPVAIRARFVRLSEPGCFCYFTVRRKQSYAEWKSTGMFSPYDGWDFAGKTSESMTSSDFVFRTFVWNTQFDKPGDYSVFCCLGDEPKVFAEVSFTVFAAQ